MMANNKTILELVNGEDFIEYYLFPKYNINDNNEAEILNSSISNITTFLQKYTRDYIWQHDGFNLTPRYSNTILSNNDISTESPFPHLYGITYYGDNIEDEWFIVYLLIQLTKEFEDLVVRAVDNDGEFLLIEAANHLPEWADPEICAKRVYVYKGYVHIVAPEVNDDNDDIDPINVESAICEVRKNPSLTVAAKNIQQSIFKKIQDYPQKIKENHHKATVYLPIGVASILKANPQLISPAVQAFCNRDPIDLKACRAMKYFPPEIRVLTSVVFTKCLYAMLMHSKYQPDKKTGWNLPPATAKCFKSHNLGAKLACGFEILIAQAKSEIGGEYDKDWNLYKKKLEDKGYFKGLLEHSKEYNDLLNKAKEYYANYKNISTTTSCRGLETLKLLQSLDLNVEEFKMEEENLPGDDDDSWLNVSPHDLDKMLEEQYGHEGILVLNNETDPTQFSSTINNFLNHPSSFEGAEYPNASQESPVRPPRGNKLNKAKVSFSADSKIVDNATKINFDPSSFACAVQNILNFVIPEDDSWDLDTDSDMSDYDVDENGKNGESNKMQELMDAMDRELAKTTIGESFVKNNDTEGFEDIEAFKPVDIDMNALKNILESYKSQLGEAGPSSNMLGPMGIQLHDNGNTNNK